MAKRAEMWQDMHFLRLLSHFAMQEHSARPMQDAFLPRRPCHEAGSMSLDLDRSSKSFSRPLISRFRMDFRWLFFSLRAEMASMSAEVGLHYGDWHHGLHPGRQYKGDRVQRGRDSLPGKPLGGASGPRNELLSLDGYVQPYPTV